MTSKGTSKFTRGRSSSALSAQLREGRVWCWRPWMVSQRRRLHKRKAKANVHSVMRGGEGVPAPRWPPSSSVAARALRSSLPSRRPKRGQISASSSWIQSRQDQHVSKIAFGRKWTGMQNRCPQRKFKAENTGRVDKLCPKVTRAWAPLAWLSCITQPVSFGHLRPVCPEVK